MPWYVFGISVSPSGTWIVLCLKHYEESREAATFRVLQWPSGNTHFELSGVINTALPDPLVWNGTLDRFACIKYCEGVRDNSMLFISSLLEAGNAFAESTCSSAPFDHILKNLAAGQTREWVCMAMSWNPAGDILAVAPHYRQAWTYWQCRLAPRADQSLVILVDTLQAGLPIVARLDLGCAFAITDLQWAPDSSCLCASGQVMPAKRDASKAVQGIHWERSKSAGVSCAYLIRFAKSK